MALIDVAQEHPDPDLDLSSALQVFMVGAAAEALPDQCLFGSNPPYDDPVASRATVEAAIADPGIRRQVMGLNAAALLRLRSGSRPRPRTRNRNAPRAARSRVDRRPDLSSSALHAVASSARMTRHSPARCDSRRAPGGISIEALQDLVRDDDPPPPGASAPRQPTGVSPRALRHYERPGLIAVARDRAGRRTCDAAAMRRVVLLARMRTSGAPIAGLRRCVELVDAGSAPWPNVSTCS